MSEWTRHKEMPLMTCRLTPKWYLRLWYWIRGKKYPTAGSGDYLIIMPGESPPGAKWEKSNE